MNKIARTKTSSTLKSMNNKPLTSTGKHKDFDLVMVGTCPHDNAELGDEIRGRGVGVSRVCEKCGYHWYGHNRIKLTRYLDCFSEQRRNKRNIARNNDSSTE